LLNPTFTLSPKDQEISSISTIASFSFLASVAAKEVEDLEPGTIDTTSELVISAYLQIARSALRTCGHTNQAEPVASFRVTNRSSYDDEALLIAARATIADVLNFVSAEKEEEEEEVGLGGRWRRGKETEERNQKEKEEEEEVLLTRKRAISSPPRPSTLSPASFYSPSSTSSDEALTSEEEGEEREKKTRNRAATLNDASLTSSSGSSSGSSLLFPSLSVLSHSRIGYRRRLLQSHLNSQELSILGSHLRQLADSPPGSASASASSSSGAASTLAAALSSLREGISRRSIYEKRRVKQELQQQKLKDKASEPSYVSRLSPFSSPSSSRAPSSPSPLSVSSSSFAPSPFAGSSSSIISSASSTQEHLAPIGSLNLRKQGDWKQELFLDLIGSGSVPMLLPGTPSEEAKFLSALAGASAELLTQREREKKGKENQKEEEEEAKVQKVFGLGPDLQVATGRLRELLKQRPHVIAQGFFNGPLAKLLFESASLSFATGDRYESPCSRSPALVLLTLHTLDTPLLVAPLRL
jgi:hypothetical protein